MAFRMEHIGHFPGSLCCIAFDGMGQGIHTCRSGKSLRHGGHHIRVNDRNDRHVMRVNAYKFTLSLDIGDNIVDRNFSSSTGCCWNGDDRNTRFFVGATPSRLLTSSNSGLAMMMPIALEVSMEEPPPMAIR